MKNDHQNFLATIERCQGIIVKAATFYAQDPMDREDLTQEIIYQIWKSYSSFKQQSKISTWIYRIAMNTALYHWRSHQNRKKVTNLWALEAQHSVDAQDERWRLLLDQINRLNHLDKSLIFLFLERKTHREIAEITGLTETNVGTRLARIKTKLKVNLSA